MPESEMTRSSQGLLLVAMLFCPLVSSSAQAGGAQSDPKGMIAFNDHCRECHSYEPNDNRIGPSLAGVVGRKAGSETGFQYSQSLKGANIIWTPALLDKWIANPNAVVPGNNMGSVFSGVSDPKIRKQVIGFLQSLSSGNASEAK